VRIDWKARTLWGEIQVIRSGEWVDTFFYFDNPHLVWENENDKERVG
jgi:hypothetical protein